jgi:hypothetical protein
MTYDLDQISSTLHAIATGLAHEGIAHSPSYAEEITAVASRLRQLPPVDPKDSADHHRANRVEEVSRPARRREGSKPTTCTAIISDGARAARPPQGSRPRGSHAHCSRRRHRQIVMCRKSAKDKELDDRNRLVRAWRKWHREQLEAALAGVHRDVFERLMHTLKI